MSTHLKVGDFKPQFNPKSKFRLYSMLFCPFAQRARLVLAAKEITDYDTVNIQLGKTNPEWYGAVNPLRKVPAIELPCGKTLYESRIVADYFDELYPKNPLHPSDPFEKAEQKLFLETIGSRFIKMFYTHLAEKTDENKQMLVETLSECEEYIRDKKTQFLGGTQPRMVDYMIWPFFERLPMSCELSPELHCNLKAWSKRMKDVPAVKKVAISEDVYKVFYDGYPNYPNGKINYDLAV